MRLLIISATVLLFATATASAQQRPSWATPVAVEESASSGIREVTASPREVITLTTKLRFTTLIMLPSDEDIMDVLAGDKDNWAISVTAHMAHVKPAVAHAETNLNLVTATGNVYSFLLREGGKTVPDLKVAVLADPDAKPAIRRFVPVAQLEAAQAELTEVRARADADRQRAADQLAEVKRQPAPRPQFAYGPVLNSKPFFVKSIWHDGAFTFIATDAKELPALYEVKDGQPSIVQFTVEEGTYIVPKVLDKAYLAIGTARFPFSLKGNGN